MTIYTRGEPDYNGWTDFETFTHNGHWWWSACDDFGDHKGFREGPFKTEDEAYRDGLRGGDLRAVDDEIDYYALSNGLSTVLPDGTLVHGVD